MTKPELDLNSGVIYEFNDLSQLTAFEDKLALVINPPTSEAMTAAWTGRVVLPELLRPSRINTRTPFNGPVTDVKLSVMDDPSAALESYRERGFILATRNGLMIGAHNEVQNSLLGFTFIANARSSGHGVIGQVHAELWYCKTPIYRSRMTGTYTIASGETRQCVYDGNQQRTSLNGGRNIRRITTKPKIETEKFIELDQTAKRIGFEVLQRNMRHPIVQPIRN